MLKEIERIVDQLRRSYEGEAWHGPALRELLLDTTVEEAATKPLPGVHSIWEIVLHIVGWEKLISDGLNGKPTVRRAEDDWPMLPDASEVEWRMTLQRLHDTHAELLKTVLRLHDSQLDDPAVEGSPSIYVILHGTVQHNLYHAGQIALLKKLCVSELDASKRDLGADTIGTA